MNYKETLFFIAKCLTISLEKNNREDIESQLKNNQVNWEQVVQISTAHYVFPALYCNLKRANFLHYLPEDLVEYMQHITDLNRERNQQIIEQAKEVNLLLLANNITPIFLKGTGNLLEGLYQDIAERMVGDIDFIVEKQFYDTAYQVLKENGYVNVSKEDYSFPQFKHQPRLCKDDKIAALEVHKELLLEKYADEFNYNFIIKDTVNAENGIKLLSFSNQLCLSIFATQINDDGIYFKTIALRNAYDVFLLSKKTATLQAIHKFDKLFNPLNNYLAICNIVFNEIDSLKFEETEDSKNHLLSFDKNITDLKYAKNKSKKTSQLLFIKTRLNIIKTSLSNKEYRTWLLKRITDKDWQNQKMIQLGFKNPKKES